MPRPSAPGRLGRLLREARGQGLLRAVAVGSAGSADVKVANSLLGIAVAIVLARTLGPEGFGTYAYVFALVSTLAIPAQFGVPRLVVRETARTQAKEQWGLMRGLWRWAVASIGALSVALALVLLGVLWIFGDRFTPLQSQAALWGCVLLPLIALSSLKGATLQGLRRVVLGQLPESIIRPGLFAVLVVVAALVFGNAGFDAARAMQLHVVAAVAALLFGTVALARLRPQPVAAGPVPEYRARLWLAAAWPLALVAGMRQLNTHTDILLLGVFTSAEDVGVYRIAAQGASLVAFGLQAIALVVSPYFARLYAQGDHRALQRLATLSGRAAFAVALPVAVAFAVWGEAIIGFLFGEDFRGGYLPLVILAAGQVVNGFFGHASTLLSMTGHERDTARTVTVAALLNIVLNVVLIPRFGANGAAAATTASLVVWNLLLWYYVRKRLGINSMAIAPLAAKRPEADD